jgi:DNA repair exonuclease SbcCD nuclease subunit
MKIALITDQHFGARNDSIAFHDYFENFYLNFFFPYLNEHGISTVIDLGDTFDRRKYINFFSLERCKKYWFDQLAINKCTLHCIVGNHCTYFKNTNDINSPDLLLNQYPNILIHSKPTVITLDNVKIVMMPWICQDNYTECYDLMQTTDAQILLGHLELKGFEMYKGSVIDHGHDTTAFEKFDVVCSGHFHHKSTRGNIHYLGAPYEMTWSDYDDERGFHIFDTTTRELQFIQNPYKMFHKIWYDDRDQSIDYVIKQDFAMYKNSIVKVIVKQKNNPHIFDLYIDKLEKQGLVDLQVVEDHLNLNLEIDDDILSEAEDTLSMLNKYVDQVQKGDQKQVLKLLQELYNEALMVE